MINDLLQSLKFVKGSVASKEFIEGLTHFKIEDGFVRGFNGTFALCAPVDTDLNCTPHALDLVKAIEKCEDAVQMTMLPNGKLNIKSGKFKVNINTLDKLTPHVVPEGEQFVINGHVFMQALNSLKPFISTDASRPWSCGVLVTPTSAYATNNVTAAEYWLGNGFPHNFVLPSQAVRELLKIKEDPIGCTLSDTSVTFHFEGDRWLRTQLLQAEEWPNLSKIIDGEFNYKVVDSTLFDALDSIKPFADKNANAYIENGTVRTHFDESEGASYNINDSSIQGVWRIEILQSLKGVAEQIHFGYPGKSSFIAQNLRGVFMGIRI